MTPVLLCPSLVCDRCSHASTPPARTDRRSLGPYRSARAQIKDDRLGAMEAEVKALREGALAAAHLKDDNEAMKAMLEAERRAHDKQLK